MLAERECKICGVWFRPKRKNNIYCEECSKRSGAKKKKKENTNESNEKRRNTETE